MAKAKMEIRVDSFLKDTRVRLCRDMRCEYNQQRSHHYGECIFKTIELDSDGICIQRKVIDADES